MAKLLFNQADYPELTYQDVCLIPYNPVEQRVRDAASSDDISRLEKHPAESKERFDVLLELAEKYKCDAPVSRDSVDLRPNGRLANTPILVANMNAVVGQRMAEAIARPGGMATIPQDKTDTEIRDVAGYLDTRHPTYETPVTVTPTTKVHQLRRVMQKRSHGAAIVQSDDGDFLGVVAQPDIEKDVDGDWNVSRVYRKDDVVTAPDGVSPFDAITLMNKERVNYLPILGADGRAIGVLPKLDAAMKLRYQANLNQRGKLRAAFTVGALNNNPMDRVRLLLELGIYDLQFDTAHADQGTRVYRNVEKTLDLASHMGIDPELLNIIVGNVVTREAVRSIMLAGAKYAKGGIGPGAACTTRMMTGVGRPQVSMILECAEEAHKHGGYLIADGGIVHPRDVSIALAAGADYVMVGSLFAGTYESPPDIQQDSEGLFKVNFGMASVRASVNRTAQRTQKSVMDIFREIVGHRGEGVSHQKVYLQPGRESVAMLHHYLLDGPTSSVTYAGGRSIREYPSLASIALQMPSGFAEGEAKTKLK